MHAFSVVKVQVQVLTVQVIYLLHQNAALW